MAGKIAVIAALEAELELLKEALSDLKEIKAAGTVFYTGKIGETEAVLTLCGMGKVSASANTQALIALFSPDAVINTGCAGALQPDMKVGDMVLSSATAEWDLDTIAIGNPRGWVSALDAVRMDADRMLAAVIRRFIPEDITVYEGLVVSGDQFVSEPSQRELILDSFPDALCAEMEGAAVGHVCAQNGVSFCVVRTMSDTADGNSGTDFARFSAQAGRQSAGVLIDMLGNL